MIGQHRKRVDANQPEIVDALRACGMSVLSLAAVGKGCPDLLIGWRGRNILLEVKDGSKPPSGRQLTDDEKDFRDSWRGSVFLVESVEQAVRICEEEASRG
jgi:hypothetical protein